MINLWILIVLLSISTFLSRIIGVKIMAGRKMNPTLRLYFNYVPVAIMSALIITQVLTISKNGHIGISFSALIGCLATTIAIKITKLFLPSVGIGIVGGLLVRYFL